MTTTARRASGTRFEPGEENARRLLALQQPFGAGALVLYTDRCVRGFAGSAPAMRTDDPECDPEQVRAQGASDIQGRPVPMQDDEDILSEVLDLVGVRSQPLQRFEYVVELALERFEATGLRRGQGRGGVSETQITHAFKL